MSGNDSLQEGSNWVTGTAGQAPGTVNIGLEINLSCTQFGATTGIGLGTTKCDWHFDDEDCRQPAFIYRQLHLQNPSLLLAFSKLRKWHSVLILLECFSVLHYSLIFPYEWSYIDINKNHCFQPYRQQSTHSVMYTMCKLKPIINDNLQILLYAVCLYNFYWQSDTLPLHYILCTLGNNHHFKSFAWN